MGKQTFIEINGKKYDAITGQMIAGDNTASAKKATVVKPQENVGVMDGFVKRPKKSSASRTAAKHAKRANTQKSSTLMRKSVQKPKKISKSTKRSQASQLKRKLGQSPRRMQQASEVSRSPHIQKFEQPAARSSIVKKQSNHAVKQAPKHASHPTKAAAVPQHSNNRQVSATQRNEKLIEKALANSKSHQSFDNHKKTKKSRKWSKKLGVSSRTVAVSSAVLAAVLLGGFFAVQNVPNFAMRVAATRAGFGATMPGYQPAGFSFNGPIDYSAGRVTVSFNSNSDDRYYDFTQTSSNWNSDALLAKYIIAEDKMYQTYVDKGRTLYIYDGSNATWVDNGIWYQVEGDSDMTTDQLIRIASSI